MKIAEYFATKLTKQVEIKHDVFCRLKSYLEQEQELEQKQEQEQNQEQE